MSPNLALEAAVALSRAPNMVRLLRRQPLPAGITLLLQMVAGDVHALNEATRLTGLDENEVTAVVELYILRVMLFRGASPRRILGVEEEVERGQIRRHMSYLMGWLHPDKSRQRVARRLFAPCFGGLASGGHGDRGIPTAATIHASVDKAESLCSCCPGFPYHLNNGFGSRILDWRRRLRPWRSV